MAAPNPLAFADPELYNAGCPFPARGPDRGRPMPSDGSVTRLLGRIESGDPAAAQQLWERYFHRLVGLARQKLRCAPRCAADEEDVALSALDTFCRNAAAGRFPNLLDRDGLWRLLVVLTARKAAHLIRDEGRQKRGGHAARQKAPAGRDDGSLLEAVLSREPTPEFAAQVAEGYERLLRALADPELEKLAIWKMEGHTLAEIAQKLGYAPRSIKRKLQLIRSLWEEELAP
jgi:DNA-directed RNA polymerase specialized sigma24 family protein